MAELRIPIIGEFKGKKAFGDADKATSKLDKGVKRLGKQLAITFGATQLLKFGKNAAKAFIEDQKEAARLTNVVKNLGLAFEAPAIKDFIADLERISGVSDSDLRPAMQSLLQVTGSVTESQKMLNQAIDISAATGINLSTVAQDLGRAFTGNTRGLIKYNIGLTKAELTTSNYADIQAKLTKLFSGANAAQLGTYAGQMDLLSVAAGNAQETIGQGLIDAMITVTNSRDVTDFVDKIDAVASRINKAIGSVARFAAVIKGLFQNATPEEIRAIFDPAQNATDILSNNIINPAILQKQAAERARAEKEAAKRAAALAALQKKALDTQKKALTLQKASKTLDLERIGIEAALKGEISKTDRLSLNLQLALLDKNEAAAIKLSGQLDAAVKRQNDLAALLLATPKAPNPYDGWKIPADILAYTAASLGVSAEMVINAPGSIPAQVTDSQSELLDALLAAEAARVKAEAAAAAAAAVYVKVTLPDGTDVTGDAKAELSNQALSGSFIGVNRVGRFTEFAAI
jgi:hypothetical protein